MTQKKTGPARNVDAIAMPPLQMTLVHAGNERANSATPASSLRQAFGVEIPKDAGVDPESIKKIIEHLNKKE